jgi:hypothetical protein
MAIHRHLKRWFVPHKHNDHRPHLIRAHGLAIMAMLILSIHASAYALRPLPVPSVKGSVLAYATNINPLDLFTLTNQERVANGLPALKLDARLNQSTYLKGQNMFSEDYWAHVSPSGIQPWYWFTQAGYKYSYAGENLAKDFDTSAGVMQGWMNSPGHRANILNPNYVDVGFSVQNGTLVGGQTTLVVAHYGSPAAAATPVPAVSTPAPTPARAAVKSATSTPVPTPATPEPTAVPSPSESPSPTASPAQPAVTGEVSPAPPAQNYGLFKPLSLVRTLNWNTLLTIILLLILLLVYAVTHLTVWRKGLRRWQSRHYRLYAAGQVAGLTVAIITLATSGFGKVG